MANPGKDKQPHIEMQSDYFNQRVDFFCQPIPEAVQRHTASFVEQAGLGSHSKVLDVGTGVGVLISDFLKQGVKPENIVGLDLSQEMLRAARQRFPKVFFYQGDIADLRLPLPEKFPKHIQSFDVVFFNACFGNMWNQEEALQATVGLLGGGGKIVISHPLGAQFVDQLHRNEPHIVPHHLPDEKVLEKWCTRLKFSVAHYENRDDYYLVILQKAD